MNATELISALVQISRSDNRLEDVEFAYIVQVGQSLGMDQYELEQAIRNHQDAPLSAPPSEQQRMNMLYYMLFLMKVDNTVSEAEKELIHYYGFKLGFSRSMLNDFIELVSQHKDGVVPSEQMINIIRKYQN